MRRQISLKLIVFLSIAQLCNGAKMKEFKLTEKMQSNNTANGLELALFANKNDINYASIVQHVQQDVTKESKQWKYRVKSSGNYQVGQAWVHLLKGKRLKIEISINDILIKDFNFDKKKKIEPYDAPLFRFQFRLENLKSSDVIKVVCIPEGKTQYELEYKLAFGTPTFDGMQVFSLKQFGAKADGKHNDLPALYKATDAAIKAGGGIVRFENNKEYRLKLENPDATKTKKYVFDLQGNKNIKFEGNGSKLILHPEKLAFINFEDCENIQVDDFTQTFDPQPYFQGKLMNLDVEQLTGDILVPRRYGIPLVGPSRQSTYFCRSLSKPLKDPTPGYIRSEHLYIEKTEVTTEDPYKIKITFRGNMKARLKRATKDGAIGNTMVMPHLNYGHYSGAHAIIARSGRVAITGVWIQSMANMGVVPKHNWGPITFSKTDMKTPYPETERFVSWRDGFHVRDNRMGIMIENGYYDGGLVYDDIFSPHSMLNKVKEVIKHKDGTMEVSLYGLSPKEMFQKGDWISAWDPKQEDTNKGIARVLSVVEGSSKKASGANYQFNILLDRKVDLKVDDYAFNEETINLDMVIRNCKHSDLGKMGTTRWRTPVLIENCEFKNIRMHIYAGDGRTIERPRPRHIEIKNSWINDKLNFSCHDAWDVSISNSTMYGPATTKIKNTENFTFQNVLFKKASETIILAKDRTTLHLKGKNKKDNLKIFGSEIELSEDSQLNFD